MLTQTPEESGHNNSRALQAASYRLKACNLQCATRNAQRAANKGLTLIEMVALIVLIGTAMPPLLTMWADTAWRSGKAESLADAGFYAQELMEEIKSKAYDEKTLNNSGPPWSSSLGRESGENYPNFDDVDDYNNYSDSPASGYTRQATVTYIRLNGTNWITCGVVPCGAVSDCSTCQQCCYKRVTVTVSRTDNIVKNVSLTTIVSGN